MARTLVIAGRIGPAFIRSNEIVSAPEWSATEVIGHGSLFGQYRNEDPDAREYLLDVAFGAIAENTCQGIENMTDGWLREDSVTLGDVLLAQRLAAQYEV
jgi:hypothetical protein